MPPHRALGRHWSQRDPGKTGPRRRHGGRSWPVSEENAASRRLRRPRRARRSQAPTVRRMPESATLPGAVRAHSPLSAERDTAMRCRLPPAASVGSLKDLSRGALPYAVPLLSRRLRYHLPRGAPDPEPAALASTSSCRSTRSHVPLHGQRPAVVHNAGRDSFRPRLASLRKLAFAHLSVLASGLSDDDGRNALRPSVIVFVFLFLHCMLRSASRHIYQSG